MGHGIQRCDSGVDSFVMCRHMLVAVNSEFCISVSLQSLAPVATTTMLYVMVIGEDG